MEKLKFELNKEESQFLLAVLGNLPTQTGAYILFARLKNEMDEANFTPKMPTDQQTPPENENKVQPSRKKGSAA